MTTLGRLSNWILPWLIYLDPMVATAYYKAVAEDEATRANARRPAHVLGAPRLSAPYGRRGAGQYTGVFASTAGMTPAATEAMPMLASSDLRRSQS